MDEETERVLEDVGLSKNEARVYAALLNAGAATPAAIAKRSRLHRTNVYDALKRLSERSLVASVQDKDARQYRAAQPEALQTMLQEKQAKLEMIMPQLKLAQQLNADTGNAGVYEGWKALTTILDEFLKYNKPILAYGIGEAVPGYLKHFMPGFHNRRIQKKVPMKHIYNFHAKERIAYLNTLQYTEAKYLPEEYDSPVTTNICGPEIIFFSVSDNPVVIRIVSEQLARAYEKYFDILWSKARI